ncbi:MAG: phosphate/phosphite/phosphonate ABC transporter substrate-binding protein [Coleofasciculus sp. S288]|nr:phosphate/phosphite/phosphonate ABC transporter substrate-binding protein [Coleofasciculus sp. S288]
MRQFRTIRETIIYFLMGISLAFILSLAACANKQLDVAPTSRPINTTPTQVSGQPVQVGILAIDSSVSINKQYDPLLSYLSEVTHRPFELIPLTQNDQFTKVAEGELDFTLNNPLAAVQLRRLYQTKFLTTLSRLKTGTKLGGVIIVRSDSEIKTVEDLRGKKGACVNFKTAAAGCIFQLYHLRQKGIDPFTDFSSFVENKSQDNIVLAVLNGTIDVGFIRTGQLEKMTAEGTLSSMNELRPLEPVNDDFPNLHTTKLYPEWPFAALKNTDPKLAETVKEALLNIPKNHPALAAAKLERFVPATDYTEVEQLIETLKLKSWDAKR